MRVRRAKPNELSQIRHMDAVCFPDDDADVTETAVWWVVTHNNELIAYGGMEFVGNGDVGYIHRAGVLPAWRGRGLQKRMIRAQLLYARRLQLKRIVSYTTPTATASGNNLVDCGFRLYRPDFLWGDTDWLYFKRDL